jgi:dTMP kinase
LSLFITFEGGEGCGKSTQAEALYNELHRKNLPTVLVHEPGGTALGEEIRKTLKWGAGNITPQVELLLFSASRAQLIAEVIQPALQKGKIVICDRFSHSTTAYQGYGRGLDLATVEMVNKLAAQKVKPDIAIFLDLSPEQGLARRGKLLDRFESQELSFHHRVREGYLKMVADEPDHWLVIDAMLPQKKISKIIWEKVNHLLVEKGYL